MCLQEETSTPAAAPVTTSSSVMSQQNIATVGQIVMPGETPAKTVSSTQEGGKRKMTFVVPKGQLGRGKALTRWGRAATGCLLSHLQHSVTLQCNGHIPM